MRWKSASGLTLVELLVVVLLLGLLSAALFPATYSHLAASTMAIGMRGKDIYVALTAAKPVQSLTFDVRRSAFPFRNSVWIAFASAGRYT